MSQRWPVVLALLGLVLVLGGYNRSVFEREHLLANGQLLRLELAPRDPRSLMTGDYMTLDYQVAREIGIRRVRGKDEEDAGPPLDGFVIVKSDARGVARLVRVQPTAEPLDAGEVRLKYRARNGRVGIGTNAYFFQEGTAQQYEAARYGEYRVDSSGEMLLVRLLDEKFNPL